MMTSHDRSCHQVVITSDTADRRWQAALAAGMMLLTVSLLRTAWLSDDSYISFRVIDNILNGYGPVWNIAERVQVYTHPLWLALCTVPVAVTGEVYYTIIILSLVLALTTAIIVVRAVAGDKRQALVALALILSSKAYLDYSSSGLENVLTHLLLLGFVIEWWRASSAQQQLLRLSLVGGACAFNRLDLILLVAPCIATLAFKQRRAAVAPILLGFAPLAAWLLFSMFYYGTPFPNTAYAKLSSGLTTSIRFERGIDYFLRTLIGDPVTLPTIAIACASILLSGSRRDWPLAAGIGLYLMYIVRVGGDFMMGRFFTAPFVVSVAVLARSTWLSRARVAAVSTAAILALGLAAPWEPALLSGYGYAFADNWLRGRRTQVPSDNYFYHFHRKIMDERRNYYEFAGLMKVGLSGTLKHVWVDDGKALRQQGQQVVVRAFIGFEGYYAGPLVHVIDPHGLSDPLLARLPGGDANSVIGHLLRDIPEGYVETVATGTNRFRDQDLAAYYEALKNIITGPLWSASRLKIAAIFFAGGYDQHLNQYLSRTRSAHGPSQ